MESTIRGGLFVQTCVKFSLANTFHKRPLSQIKFGCVFIHLENTDYYTPPSHHYGRKLESSVIPTKIRSIKLKHLFPILAATFLAGCAAKPILEEAQHIEIVNEAPDRTKCQLLGEITGSQGNWFTGDFTSNKNLVVGARNELRNQAHKLGGNMVHMQDMKNASAWGSLGTTNTTAVGKVYRCK